MVGWLSSNMMDGTTKEGSFYKVSVLVGLMNKPTMALFHRGSP